MRILFWTHLGSFALVRACSDASTSVWTLCQIEWRRHFGTLAGVSQTRLRALSMSGDIRYTFGREKSSKALLPPLALPCGEVRSGPNAIADAGKALHCRLPQPTRRYGRWK